ncbi:MAG: STAS domain-containing protein [Pseudomonadota bacterium]|nr:STAS domain-containing protein [Pseudomonadota bacterium]
MFIVDASAYAKPWAELKSLGIDAIQRGETIIDVSAWTEASSAHLAVMVYWWKSAHAMNQSLTVTGMNSTFETLAELGGVMCIETGESDAGH